MMIKRYTVESDDSEAIQWETESPSGEYVKYDDIKHLIKRSENSDYVTALEKIIEECCDDYYKESTKTVKQIVEEIQRLNATHFA